MEAILSTLSDVSLSAIIASSGRWAVIQGSSLIILAPFLTTLQRG